MHATCCMGCIWPMADIAWKGCICCQGCMALQTLWWQHHKETMNSLVLEFPYFPGFFFLRTFFQNLALLPVSLPTLVTVMICAWGKQMYLLQWIHLLTSVLWQLTACANATSNICKRPVINSSSKIDFKIVFTDRLHKLSSQIVFKNCLHGSSSTVVFKYCGLSGDLSFGPYYQTVTYSGQRS